MVLPAALGIVLTAGLGLGSIVVSPTAGADELSPKAAQTSEAVPAAAPDGAEASTPRVGRPIDEIVDRPERGAVKKLADAPAGNIEPAPSPMGAPQINILPRQTEAPSPTPGESPTPAPPAPSATPSAVPSPSAAPSASATASPSPSASAEPSASPSAAPSASATASPKVITGKPEAKVGGDGPLSTTALSFKSSNWADAKGHALNGTVNMTVNLYGAGGAIDRKATIPVMVENGAFSTMIDAETLFDLSAKDLVDNGRFRLRISSPDGRQAETRLFSFVAGTRPAPAPTAEPSAPVPSAAPTAPAPTSGPTAPAPSADPKPAPTAEPSAPVPSAAPTAPAPTSGPTAPAPSADPKPAPTAEPSAQPAPPTPDAPAPLPEAPAPIPEGPAPQEPAPEVPAPEGPYAAAKPTAGAEGAPGVLPEAPAADPAAPPTIIATLPATPEGESAPAQPEASSDADPSASPSAAPTEPKPSDPPRSPVADGSQLTADNAGSLSGGRQGDRVSLVLPKDKAKEGDWVAVFLYPGGESAGWVQVDRSNSVQVDISSIDAGSHKLAIAGRDSQLLGWVQLEIARTDTVNTDLMDKANSAPVKEAVLGGDDWMLISAAGILTAGAAAYMFLARPRARRPVQ
ncbi:hypothetical protein [Actinomyces gaoshouyii]|uniref:hypothetical protein n=1 Tax=Actinomyces gaoshouyii TaxID=1960083 RepID=UPI001F0A420F|nr:hypothetical protein [Actinomyces gaoshouyii]